MALRFAAQLYLDITFCDGLSADSNSYRYADKVGVLEFDTAAKLAVVEQDIDIVIEQLLIDFFGGLGDLFLVLINAGNQNLKWSNTDGENDAVIVVADFDGGGKDSVDADAVTAHNAGLFISR
ncbi:unnamed protein product, partial [marine sediment metagenome]